MDRYDFRTLGRTSDREREAALRAGRAPDPESLLGWEFRGYNTPLVTKLLGIRKFKKGFYREDPLEESSRRFQGYNVRVRQNGLAEPWIDQLRGDEPRRHGYYEVYPVADAADADRRYPDALLLDYDSPRNLSVDPSRRLRDYLVQPYPDDPDLLLGKAYVALWGRTRIFASYFVLARETRAIW